MEPQVDKGHVLMKIFIVIPNLSTHIYGRWCMADLHVSERREDCGQSGGNKERGTAADFTKKEATKLMITAI
ncbi:hypothetical protein RchiOBHm_Chr6g0297671 [Rosa chinensis]|uniref:Uncharacterized protein n=1 Tax=Rosa chinensis TaxID=74649 RepID=A0A2P6PXQ8_ROSCH|nr:hypothetical protein RchiOBHm_Chr6g0297671 [Rosa chinensis]